MATEADGNATLETKTEHELTDVTKTMHLNWNRLNRLKIMASSPRIWTSRYNERTQRCANGADDVDDDATLSPWMKRMYT